jgi:hypothetical protein
MKALRSLLSDASFHLALVVLLIATFALWLFQEKPVRSVGPHVQIECHFCGETLLMRSINEHTRNAHFDKVNPEMAAFLLATPQDESAPAQLGMNE